MAMNYNFRFKKFLKYFFLGVLCYLLFNSINAKALSYNNGSLNINTGSFDNITDMLSSGGETDLKTYFNDNVVNDGSIDNYITSLHTSIYTASGYNSFNEFEEDNYYSIVYYWFNGGIYNTYVYYTDKENGQFHFNLVADSQSSSSIAYNTEIRFSYVPSMYSSYFSGNLSTLVYSGLYGTYNNNLTYTGPNTWSSVFTTYCRNQYRPDCTTTWNGNTSTLTAPIGTFIANTGRKFFYESNMSLDLYLDTNSYQYTSNNDTSRYFHNYYINGGLNNATDLPYTLGEFLTTLFDLTEYVEIPEANVNSLGNNSFGVNTNYVSNIFLDEANDNSTTINCPTDRGFIGNVCYLYSSDITDFDVNNTDVRNASYWFVYSSDNTLYLDYEKYYIFSFRLYTSYNLDIVGSIYKLDNDNNDYAFTIVNTYYNDYSLYKDYFIVVQPNHNYAGALNSIYLVFQNLNTLTNSLDNNYSFGIFKTIKLTEYNNIPTSTDLENEIKNNSLDTISNFNSNSFFSDFSINDRGLSQFVTLPLTYITSFKNSSCSPITIPFPHLSNITIPCMSTFISNKVPTFWNLYVLLINGFVIYRIFISLLGDIKNIHKPDNDRIEVIDL